MRKAKQAITRAVTNGIRPLRSPTRDAWALGPDELRNQVQGALSTLCEADRRALRRRLLIGLSEAGVHVGASLFMLGIPAYSLDDLTPSDMGMLLRYVRINKPAAIRALNGLLADLVVAKEASALTARRVDEAA